MITSSGAHYVSYDDGGDHAYYSAHHVLALQPAPSPMSAADAIQQQQQQHQQQQQQQPSAITLQPNEACEFSMYWVCSTTTAGRRDNSHLG